MPLDFHVEGAGVKFGRRIFRRDWAINPRAVRAGKLFEQAAKNRPRDA
jgi:hypothetical protein